MYYYHGVSILNLETQQNKRVELRIDFETRNIGIESQRLHSKFSQHWPVTGRYDESKMIE